MLYNANNPHGGDVYGGDVKLDFSANTNPFGAPPGVAAAIEGVLSELHRYPDPYCRGLVSAISGHEGVPKGSVLCGAGAAELIYSYCEAVRPRKAMELAPTFSEYSAALLRTGCEVVRHTLREEDGFLVTETVMDSLERERPEVLFLCDPNNPTGRLIPNGLKEEMLLFCKENGISVFADECFMDLSRGKSLVPELGRYPRLTVLKAFTKSFGMAGIRLGYVVSADAELLSSMSRAVQPWNVSTPAQAAGIAALGETGFVEKTRLLMERERPRLIHGLEELGLMVFGSDTNFILFRGGASLGQALKERGIALRDCSNYPGLCKGFYRTAVRLPEENDMLIEAIRGVLWQGT